jgi:hypothetical protein
MAFIIGQNQHNLVKIFGRKGKDHICGNGVVHAGLPDSAWGICPFESLFWVKDFCSSVSP